MSTPLVTIITPTYNRPALFAECATAVLAQRFTDWVWWVVYNFADDDSVRQEMALSYADIMVEDVPRLFIDPRYVPIYFPTSRYSRMDWHIPAQIVNWLYPKVQTPYIYFLADDDLIDPEGLEALVGRMNPEPYGGVDKSYWCDAAYGRCEVVDKQADGSYKHGCWCYPSETILDMSDDLSKLKTVTFDVGLGTGIDPKCRLDGGQLLHTKRLWEMATQDGWMLTDSKADAAANDGTLLSRLAQFARFHYVPQRIVTHRRHSSSTYHKPQLGG